MILHRTGKLRLVIDEHDLTQGSIVHDDAGELCRLAVAPEWCNQSPVETAELCLKAIRPTAPAYIPNAAESRSASGERRAGSYNAPSDAITVYDRDSRTDGELAEILLHELGHAAGHPTRTARWRVAVVEPDAPVIFSGHDGEDSRFEESVASLSAHTIATRLGICCRWNLSPVHFMRHMEFLPVERLKEVVSQARRGSEFLLGTTTNITTTTTT